MSLQNEYWDQKMIKGITEKIDAFLLKKTKIFTISSCHTEFLHLQILIKSQIKQTEKKKFLFITHPHTHLL